MTLRSNREGATNEGHALDRRRFLQWAAYVSTPFVWAVACSRDEADVSKGEADPHPSASSEAVPSPIEFPGLAEAQRATPDSAQMAAALRAEFEYLELDPVGVERYCGEYLQHRGKVDLAGRDFYSRFLLSSDFFQNGAVENRPIGYVAFSDPYVTGCSNPLALFDAT